jgi:hypothetical protein
MNNKRYFTETLKTLIPDDQENSAPDLDAIETILNNSFYQDNLKGRRNTRESESWLTSWLSREADRLLKNEDFDAAANLMSRSCWKVLNFSEKNSLEKKLRENRVQKILRELEHSVNKEGYIALEIAERILNDPYYREHLLGTSHAYAVEVKVTDSLLAFVDSLLNNLKTIMDISTNRIRNEGIGIITHIDRMMSSTAWNRLKIKEREKESFKSGYYRLLDHMADTLSKDPSGCHNTILKWIYPRIYEKKKYLYPLRSEPKTVSTASSAAEFNLDSGCKFTGNVFNKYLNNEDGTISDYATGLMWQQSGSDEEFHSGGIEPYLRSLNAGRFAGCDDWRLPTVPELLSLLENRHNPHRLQIFHLFDGNQPFCWSADRCENGRRWIVFFINRFVGFDSSGGTESFVRAVRGL